MKSAFNSVPHNGGPVLRDSHKSTPRKRQSRARLEPVPWTLRVFVKPLTGSTRQARLSKRVSFQEGQTSRAPWYLIAGLSHLWP